MKLQLAGIWSSNSIPNFQEPFCDALQPLWNEFNFPGCLQWFGVYDFLTVVLESHKHQNHGKKCKSKSEQNFELALSVPLSLVRWGWVGSRENTNSEWSGCAHSLSNQEIRPPAAKMFEIDRGRGSDDGTGNPTGRERTFKTAPADSRYQRTLVDQYCEFQIRWFPDFGISLSLLKQNHLWSGNSG